MEVDSIMQSLTAQRAPLSTARVVDTRPDWDGLAPTPHNF